MITALNAPIVLKVLRQTRYLLREPEYWCKEKLCIDRMGEETLLESELTYSYCLTGAVSRAAYDMGVQLDDCICEIIDLLCRSSTLIANLYGNDGIFALGNFNDDSEYEVVIDALDAAIALAEKEAQE